MYSLLLQWSWSNESIDLGEIKEVLFVQTWRFIAVVSATVLRNVGRDRSLHGVSGHAHGDRGGLGNVATERPASYIKACDVDQIQVLVFSSLYFIAGYIRKPFREGGSRR